MRDWLGGLPSEWKLRISLVILLLIGSVLLFIFGESLSHAIAEVGIALIIAAILGLTVDRALKTDLVQNVFLAAFKPNFEGWTFDGVGKGPQMLGFCARVRYCGAK